MTAESSSCLAGHFHRLDKAVTSLRNNAIFYLVLMVRRVWVRQGLPAFADAPSHKSRSSLGTDSDCTCDREGRGSISPACLIHAALLYRDQQ